MNAEQLALYELHSAAVNYIWTFWLLSGRGKVPECRDWPEPEKKAYDRWLDANQKTTKQRRPTMLYWLRRPHPLRAEYAIGPRTKWGVVALPGAPPPKEASDGPGKGSGPKAKVRERNVAKYFLSNFTTWTAWERPGEHVQRWYLRDGIKPAGVAPPPYEPEDYKPFDYTTWRMHCELLALVASVALPRCSSTDKREKRHRCLEGVERRRWEDRVEAVLRVQTWVRLHGLTRRHMGSRWPTPRSKKHFKALRRAAKVDVLDKEAKLPIWRELKEELKKQWRAHVLRTRTAGVSLYSKGDEEAAQRKRMANLSSEERQALVETNAAARRVRVDNLSSEEKQALREITEFVNRRCDINRRVSKYLVDEARRARFIAAARLFDIENVMTGFR